MSKQCLFNLTAGPNASTANFTFAVGGWQSVQERGTMIWPASGVFKNFQIKTVDPGSGNSLTFTLKINGVASAVVLVFNSGDTLKQDLTNQISVSAGDKVVWETTPVSTPTTGATEMSWDFDSTTNKESGYACFSTDNINATNYFPVAGSTHSTTEINARSIVPIAGEINRLYVKTVVDPNPGNWTVAIYKNGTIQDGAGGTPDTRVTVPSGTTSGTIRSATFTLSVSAGDELSIGWVAASSPTTTAVEMAVNFVASGSAKFIIFGNSLSSTTGALSSDQFCYARADQVTDGWGGTEANEDNEIVGVTPFRITDMYAGLNAAAGGSLGVAMILRKSTVSTALSCSIGAAQTQANSSSNVDVVAGSVWSVLYDTLGTALSAKTPRWGLAAQVVGGGNAGGNVKPQKGGGGVSVQNPGGANNINLNPAVSIGNVG